MLKLIYAILGIAFVIYSFAIINLSELLSDIGNVLMLIVIVLLQLRILKNQESYKKLNV